MPLIDDEQKKKKSSYTPTKVTKAGDSKGKIRSQNMAAAARPEAAKAASSSALRLKPKQPEKWYKGDKPTETETIAKIVKTAETDRATAEKAYAFYEQAKSEGEWKETYDKATSPYLAALGIEDPSQINDDFFAANADLLNAGVHTSTGGLSSAKKNGPEALLAYNLSGLYSDYNATKDMKAEQDQIIKEAQYWMNKGLSDDEIKQKLNIGGDGSKYKKIGAALDNAKLGKFTPTTDQIWAATSWGVDGMLFSLRNPDKSTGNYFNDAVQRDMGRGKTVETDPVAAAKRDRGSAAWAPYSNGTTMDAEAIRFGVTEFSPDWAEKNRAAILASGDEDAIKAFGKVMEAEEFTQQAEGEAEAFRENVLRKIEAGTPPEEIFSGDFLDGYDALEKLYDGYMAGAPAAVTRGVDFDIAEYMSMAEAAYAKQKGAYTTDEYEANMAEATGGTHIPDETKQKVNDGFNLDYNILLPQYAPIATDRERQAFRVIANAGYSDVVYVSHDMIANGTGGKPQMDASLQKSAISFANENIASAIENMNINVLPAVDYLSEGTKEILTEMFPEIIAEGRVPTEDDYNAFMEQNFSTPDSLFSPERQLYEAAWMQTLGDRERAAVQTIGEEQKRADGQKLYEDIKAEVAGAFGEDTEDYRAVMATYEAAMPYARGVPRVWNAFDEYQLAAGTEGMTPDGLNMVLTNQRGQNARNIKFLQAQVNNFKELGLPQNFIDNAQQQLDDLIVQNELLGAHRLAENEDFASVGKAFDDAFGSVPPQFTQVSRDEMVRNAIMNPELAIAFVNSQAGQQGAMSNFSELHEMAELAAVMAPEELAIYKYKYGKEGPESATAYFEALSNNLAVRSAQEMSENVQEWAKQNELTSAVATVGSVLLTPLEALGSLDAVLRMAMGEEVNWYDDSFMFSRTKSDLRTGTKEGFAEAYPDNKLAQSIYNTLYDAITSAGDNLITAASGNPVAARALMAMSGMNSAMMDASMRGADSKRVVMYGLATAAVEFATEKIGMDNIIKSFSSGGAAGVKGLAFAVIENFGAEFGEEFASGILGTAVDDAIMQAMSNRDAAIAEYEAMGLTREEAEAQAAKDILTDSLYGGLVGGISGGISSGISYTAGWAKGNEEQSAEITEPVEEAAPEEGTEQQRATSLLATAAAGDVGESQKAATTSSVLSTFGVVEEEATAASKKIAENGSMRKVLNLFKVATDPEKISAAITMAANAAGSQCAAIMNGDINPKNALENVGKLITAYNEDRQNKAVMAEYDAAVTESMEADATVQVLATMPPVDSSKKDAAEEALREGQEKADASHTELRAASDAVAQSHELLKQNPADVSLLQKLRTDIQKRAQAEARAVDADREVAKLKDAAKKAGIEFQTQTEKQLNEARAQAIETVAQKRAEWNAQKAQAANAELVLENEQPEAADKPITQEQTAVDQQTVFDSAKEETAPVVESDAADNEAVQPIAQNEAESPAVTAEPAQKTQTVTSTAPAPQDASPKDPVPSAPAPTNAAPSPAEQVIDYIDDVVAQEVEKYKEELDKGNEEFREKYLQKRDELAKRGKYRNQIRKGVADLVKMVEKPTGKKHVIAGLDTMVVDFLKELDLGTRGKKAVALGEKIRNVAATFAENNASPDAGIVIDPDVIESMSILAKETAALDSFGKLTTEQMRDLRDMVASVKHVVKNADKMFTSKRNARISDVGARSVQQISQKADYKAKEGMQKKMKDLLSVGMLDSFHFFDTLGSASKEVFNGVREGLNKKTKNIQTAVQYVSDTVSGADKALFLGDKAPKTGYKTESGATIELTKPQVMELYCLNKRDAAKRHLLYGGIRTIDNVSGVKLTETDIETITSSLSESEREIADKLQQFMSDQCSEWANETSMAMSGYRKFREKNYYPMKVDENTVKTSQDLGNKTNDLYAVMNKGFTKDLRHGAANQLLVGDIFDTFSQYVDDVTTYNAYAAPVYDMIRWFNYKPSEGVGLKTVLEQKIGAVGRDYIPTLIRDLNGGTGHSYSPGLAEDMTRRAKSASIGANIRVAIQQPTAIARAAMVMNPKYIAAGAKATPKALNEAVELAKKYCPIAAWKSMGFYETNIGNSLQELMFPARKSLKDKVIEAGMWLPGKMDELTFGALWRACEKEVTDGDSSLTGEELYQAVGKRLSEVIDYTQVVDTPLHRTQLMRSKDKGVQLATSFMTEPAKTYNMLQGAIAQAKANPDSVPAKKQVSRALAVYTTTALLTAVAQSLWDGVRDDEDDEYLEKVSHALLGNYEDAETIGDYAKIFMESNVGSSLNPLNTIPFVKDIISMMRGYEPTRLDLQAASKVVMLANQLPKAARGESEWNAYQWVKSSASALSYVTGIPVSNLIRDMVSVHNTVAGMFGGEKIVARTQPVGITEQAEHIYDAIVSGDKEAFDKWVKAAKNGKKPKNDNDIDLKVAEILANEDDRIAEAGAYRNAGRATEVNRIGGEVVADLASGGVISVERAVEIVDKAIKNYAPKPETKFDPDKQLNAELYASKDVASAVFAMAGANENDVTPEDIQLMISELTADSSAKDPAKQVATNIRNAAKEMYAEYINSGADKEAIEDLDGVLMAILSINYPTLEKWKEYAESLADE